MSVAFGRFFNFYLFLFVFTVAGSNVTVQTVLIVAQNTFCVLHVSLSSITSELAHTA